MRNFLIRRRIQLKDLWKLKLITRLVILTLFIGSVIGCVGAPPAVTPTLPTIPLPTNSIEATVPPDWVTYSNDGQCQFSISHPLQSASQGTYSWILTPADADPGGQIRNFVYVSVIPEGFDKSGGEIIYNYDPAEAESLLNMQVGESKSLREDPNTAPWFTYTRVLDTVLDNQSAQTYENNQPWEFPLGTKEIRSYLQANGCTYLIGGYISTVGSGQSGAIDEEFFRQIITTFRLSS